MTKVKHIESAGLLLMTGIGAILSVVAICRQNPRAPFLVALTIAAGVIAFIARFRHHRQVKTLPATGRRKHEKTK